MTQQRIKEKLRRLLPFAAILTLALILRWYGINWDEGWHLHPDERMLIMVADKVHLFDHMNPEFFNYGSLPIYILKAVAQILAYFFSTPVAGYDGLLSIGRGISVALEIGTIILIYKTALLLFDNQKKVGQFAAILYTIAFFPIQNSHFFIVDNFLNIFMAAIAFYLISYMKKPQIPKIVYLGIFAAAAVTTKATGLILLAPIGLILLLPYHKQSLLEYIFSTLSKIILFGFFYSICAYLFMPYAFAPSFEWFSILQNPLNLLNPQLVNDVSLQMKMNSDPFIFPYTLQYVMTTPYLYYIKNIVLWGLGPFISIISLGGLGLFFWTIIKALRQKSIKLTFFKRLFLLPKMNFQVLTMIYLLYYLLYFVIIGRSAVKFMRYMLPVYAPLTILGGYCLYQVLTYYHKVHNQKPTRFQITIKPWVNGIGLFLLIGAVLWTLMFERIYSNTHTRIAASRWIYQNIPPSSTIAVEHWDDRLPLPLGNVPFTFNELTIYDPDTSEKWDRLNALLQQSEYMIIASNRLYTPLSKLTDCEKLPISRCYPQTAEYYKQLFKGERGFEKVAEFTSYPTLQIGTWKIEVRDDNADESFTVYDHPKILIFKRKI